MILDKIFTRKKPENPTNLTEVELLKRLKYAIKKTSKNSTLAEVIPWQLYRYVWSYEDWRNAVDMAEDVHEPDRYDLTEIYHDIVDDYAVFSAMQQRTSKAINSKIIFLNEDGSENEEISRFFINPDGTQKAWFRKWLKIAQDTKYYGFEVAELGQVIDGQFLNIGFNKAVVKIPEQNLVPLFRLIKKDGRAGITEDNSILMDYGNFSPWLVPMGNERDIGILSKCVPYVIWKYIFGNWRQHAEIFGQPFREGRTDIYDNDRVAQMAKMFEDMTASAYGIFHPDDEINFIETSKTDAYNIYDRLIERCDNAITKIILSQTGTTDEKSYVGAAEAHERVIDQLVTSDRLDLSEYFSEVLLPKLKGLGLIPMGVNITLSWVIEEKISLNDWAQIISTLSNNYNIPAEEVEKRFNMVVEDKEPEPVNTNFNDDKGVEQVQDIMNKTQDYYKKLWREL